jgi:predicted ATP-binding protein involved in virulence
MIKDLLSSLKPAQKEKAVIDGLRKEINIINNTLNFYSKENAELKKGLINNTSNYDLFISKYQKQLDSLTSKCFLMENTINKKDNTIRQLNKKIDDTLFYKELEGNIYIRETYVSLNK